MISPVLESCTFGRRVVPSGCALLSPAPPDCSYTSITLPVVPEQKAVMAA
jgi:hypothetical protein